MYGVPGAAVILVLGLEAVPVGRFKNVLLPAVELELVPVAIAGGAAGAVDV